MNKVFRRVMMVSLIVAISLVLAGDLVQADFHDIVYHEGHYEEAAVSENGMVATARKLASDAALEVLKDGGNAVDAAAVAQFSLNVVEPYMTGIGGGFFMVIYLEEEDEVLTICAREEAPYNYHEEVFLDEDGDIIPFTGGEEGRVAGGKSVGVPGTLAGIAKALEDHGTITLAEALEPAIQLAEEGFPLREDDASFIEANEEKLGHFEATREIYFDEDGNPLQEGDMLINEDLADTFRLIAEEGPEVFYEGEIAEDIVEAVQEAEVNPGLMELDDLKNYRAVEREPVKGTFREYDIYAMGPPNSGGISMIKMLNILEGYDLAAMGWGTLDMVHYFNEAQKVTFPDRNRYMADADWVDMPIEGLLSKKYAEVRRDEIKPHRALSTPVEPGNPWYIEGLPGTPWVMDEEAIPQFASGTQVQEGSTTHFSVVDEDRNAVAVTSTIEQVFGSGLVVPGRGFLLNNELTDFNPVPRHEDGLPVANRPEGGREFRSTAVDAYDTLGGKRPRSSMTPTIVMKDGAPFLTAGSPGGSRIFGVVLNVVTNILEFDMDPQKAINVTRIINRNGPLEIESGLYEENPEMISALESRGHQVNDIGTAGGAQAIMIDPETGELLGGADPRRHGYVSSY